MGTLPWRSQTARPSGSRDSLPVPPTSALVCTFHKRALCEEKGESFCSQATAMPVPPAQSPPLTLLSCMSRLAPFFNSKSVASTLLTAAAQ